MSGLGPEHRRGSYLWRIHTFHLLSFPKTVVIKLHILSCYLAHLSCLAINQLDYSDTIQIDENDDDLLHAHD